MAINIQALIPIAIQILERIPVKRPPEHKPMPTISQVFDYLDQRAPRPAAPAPLPPIQTPVLPAITGLKSPPQPPATPADGTLDTGGTKGTACLPCSTDHLSTSSASLAEAMRFARKEGVGHPEVMRRVDLAQDELNVMERIDMHPATVANLPPDQKEFLNQMIPKIREVRQDLGRLTAASPVSDLENVAARMDEVKTAFRNKTRDILAAKIRSMTPEDKARLVDSLSTRLAERKGEPNG